MDPTNGKCPICGKAELSLCVLVCCNNTKQYRTQCQSCGRVSTGSLPHASIPRDKDVPAMDVGFREACYSAASAFWKIIREYKNRKKQENWWAVYNAYLNSDEWKSKRARILKRDLHGCRRCGARGLLHVHHLTYERMKPLDGLFDEQDSDLLTLCERCHTLAHGEKNQ